jgi:hypothetical protein
MPNPLNARSVFLEVSEYALFAGLLLASDAVASLFVVGWNWLRNDSLRTTMFYTGSPLDYLRLREPIFLVVLAAASVILNRPVRGRVDSGVPGAGAPIAN